MAHLVTVYMACSWHQQSKHVPAVAHFQGHHLGQSWWFMAEASYCQKLKVTLPENNNFWRQLQTGNNMFCNYTECTWSGGQCFHHLLCHWWVLIHFPKVIITAHTLTSSFHWLLPLPTSCIWHGTPADDILYILSNRKWTTLYKYHLTTPNSPLPPFNFIKYME
jgi:hypothetical protein